MYEASNNFNWRFYVLTFNFISVSLVQRREARSEISCLFHIFYLLVFVSLTLNVVSFILLFIQYEMVSVLSVLAGESSLPVALMFPGSDIVYHTSSIDWILDLSQIQDDCRVFRYQFCHLFLISCIFLGLLLRMNECCLRFQLCGFYQVIKKSQGICLVTHAIWMKIGLMYVCHYQWKETTDMELSQFWAFLTIVHYLWAMELLAKIEKDLNCSLCFQSSDFCYFLVCNVKLNL